MKHISFASGVTDHDGFLTVTSSTAVAEARIPLFSAKAVRRWVALHRFEPFWMTLKAGTDLSEVPDETQHLLIQHADGQFTQVVPLITDSFRAQLVGGPNGIDVIVESGSESVTDSRWEIVRIAQDSDPYRLRTEAAIAITERLGKGRLREDKVLPEFIEDFGWCTWDAFYSEVSHDKVREGLESFQKGGVTPKYLILDDGWQSIADSSGDQRFLTSLSANEKFPGDLAPTVQMAKDEFGIETFIVWHAFQGYWAGNGMSAYDPVPVTRQLSPTMAARNPGFNNWINVVQTMNPARAHAFFSDYHRHLRRQGVDGVKVDNQSALESTGMDFGGRVAMMRAYREALEGSVAVHFNGNLINCMSCSNDVLLQAFSTNLLRTSTDFWPNRPETHGEHLAVNAHVSFFIGELIHPDWDMFQSNHAIGSFHAAGRAVSGGPVYVSDKPGEHDFDLLRKLVLPDGSILRSIRPGVPSRDCLMTDPRESGLLKVVNLNLVGGVIGIFNCSDQEEREGIFSPADLEDLDGDVFGIYGHQSGEVVRAERDTKFAIALPPLGWEIVTVVPLDSNGFAPLGLADMLNSGGAIDLIDSLEDEVGLTLVGGRHVAFAARRPKEITFNGEMLSHQFQKGRLEFVVPEEGGVVWLYW
jgi:raffinose synthase